MQEKSKTSKHWHQSCLVYFFWKADWNVCRCVIIYT